MEHGPMSPEAAAPEIAASLAAGKPTRLRVTGSSMEPFLHHGRDCVALALPGTLRRGQILLFRRDNGALVLHRLAAVEPEGLRMNGDSQTWTETIRREQVLAVAETICRPDGREYPVEGRWMGGLWRLWWLLRPLRPGLLRLLQGRRRNPA